MLRRFQRTLRAGVQRRLRVLHHMLGYQKRAVHSSHGAARIHHLQNIDIIRHEIKQLVAIYVSASRR